MSGDWLGEFFDWWTTQRVSATAAVVATAAGVTAATSGVRTLRQNRRDSKARSRPVVAAELREVPYVKTSEILVVRNYGPSIARNVRVRFASIRQPHPGADARHGTGQRVLLG